MVCGAQVIAIIIVIAIHRRRRNIEQASAKRELVGAMAVGKEAVVTNAMEAIRQYVKEEAAYEFGDRYSHGLVLMTATCPIVPAAETDVGLIKIEQAIVGDRDGMRVAREIGQDLLGTGEGLFGIEHPFGLTQGFELGGKYFRVVEIREIGKEFQFAGIVRCDQTLQEQARENANRKKESEPAGDPALAVR